MPCFTGLLCLLLLAEEEGVVGKVIWEKIYLGFFWVWEIFGGGLFGSAGVQCCSYITILRRGEGGIW